MKVNQTVNIAIAGLLAVVGLIVASDPAQADDSCRVVVHAFSQKPANGQYAKYGATVELVASVENVEGFWQKNLRPEKQDQYETKTHYVDTATFVLKGEDFCAREVQLRLEGTCIVKAVTHRNQSVGISNAFKPVWLPAFNKPSMDREFKAELC